MIYKKAALEQILLHPQFSRAEVLQVAGISSGQLKGLLDRGHIRLDGRHNPGTGRRRLYTGGDIIKIYTAATANEIGLPLRWARLMGAEAARRAHSRLIDPPETSEYTLGAWPLRDDDGNWIFADLNALEKIDPPIPFGFQIIRVDALIDLVFAKLAALGGGEDDPS